MKYKGKVGFGIESETSPGVWEEIITERSYFMELSNPIAKWKTGSKANDDLTISTQISFIMDPFSEKNFYSIKYVEYLNTNWEVENVEVQRPRLILTLGGRYTNG